MRRILSLAAVAVVFALSGALARAADTSAQPAGATLTGAAAFGGWEESAPGVTRLIKPSDLPAPYQTKSSSNAPAASAMPPGAKPRVADGFAVTKFAGGMSQPRVIRIAPNGDVFVADSGCGRD